MNARALTAAIHGQRSRARTVVVLSGRGAAVPRILDGGVETDGSAVAWLYEPADLLSAHLDTVDDIISQVVGDLADDVHAAIESRGPQPCRPVSVLLHGRGRAAMTLIVHELAYALAADLVQIDAPAVLPTSNGGCQPIVAPAVRLARRGHPSVLLIDQVEKLAVDADDARRQRALNDVLGEALRADYGRLPVVVAMYEGVDVPARALTQRFDRQVYVDMTEYDDAVPPRRVHAPAAARTTLTHQHVQRSACQRSPSVEFAA